MVSYDSINNWRKSAMRRAEQEARMVYGIEVDVVEADSRLRQGRALIHEL